MTTQSTNSTAATYTIPGVADPIPVTAVTDLVAGSEVSGTISDLAQTNWYRFHIEANARMDVTFTGSLAEYTLQPYLRYVDKGSANAHSPRPETDPSTAVVTYTFQLPESNEIFLAIARLDGATGNGGYTLRLASGPIDKGSANAH